MATSNLGKAHLDMGRIVEAEEHFRQALAIAERVYPEGHANLGIARAYHALATGGLGRREEAEPKLLTAHGTVVDALGADHPRSRQIASEIASFYADWNRPEESRRWRGLSQEPTGRASGPLEPNPAQ
jgi:hypothetical protein